MLSVLLTLTHGCFTISNIYIVGRILSIDYGKKRTGLAVTDPLKIIANGLATVSTHLLWDFLHDYISKESIERIVVGKPMQTNGLPSENLQRVEAFAARWKGSPGDTVGLFRRKVYFGARTSHYDRCRTEEKGKAG